MKLYSRNSGITTVAKKKFMIKGFKESLNEAKQQIKAIQAQLKIWENKKTK